MRKHIVVIIASTVALVTNNTVIAQHSYGEHDIEEAHASEQEQAKGKQQKYTCPMHPEVITDHPGNCPK